MTLAELLANVTPGPWESERAYVQTSRGNPVAETHASIFPGSFAEADANARLIALAPDLARLALDMGEALRSYRYSAMRAGETRFEKTDALLARLDGIANDW